jgi:transcription initiation factor TFIID TATA-box-binding protein
MGIISSSEPSSDEIIDEFVPQNIVLTADVQDEINLDALAIGLGLENTEYEPEQFPGLVYRSSSGNCTILAFSTGKVVLTGVTSESVAQDEFTNFTEKLEQYLDTG